MCFWGISFFGFNFLLVIGGTSHGIIYLNQIPPGLLKQMNHFGNQNDLCRRLLLEKTLETELEDFLQ